MPHLSVESYNQTLERSAERSLKSLQRLDAHFDKVYGREREHERKEFRGMVTITLRDQNDPEGESFVNYQAWARNISRSGLGFIFPDELDETIIQVGIPSPRGGIKSFAAEVVRKRKIEEELFWEYGVVFLSRTEPTA